MISLALRILEGTVRAEYTTRALPEIPRPKIFAPTLEQAIEAMKAEYADMFDIDGSTWYVELQYGFDRLMRALGYDGYGVSYGAGCAAVHSIRVEDYTLIQPTRGVSSIDLLRDRKKVGSWSNDDIRRTGSGRLGGLHGWDVDNYAVSGHYRTVAEGVRANIGAILAKYSSPPSLPFRGEWKVPVIALTGPVTGVLPLSSLFRYRLLRPAIVLTTTSVVAVEEGSPSSSPERSLWIGLWGSGREKLGGVEVPGLEGGKTYEIVVRFLGLIPRLGFFEITPIHTVPRGITVLSVDTRPISV